METRTVRILKALVIVATLIGGMVGIIQLVEYLRPTKEVVRPTPAELQAGEINKPDAVVQLPAEVLLRGSSVRVTAHEIRGPSKIVSFQNSAGDGGDGQDGSDGSSGNEGSGGDGGDGESGEAGEDGAQGLHSARVELVANRIVGPFTLNLTGQAGGTGGNGGTGGLGGNGGKGRPSKNGIGLFGTGECKKGPGRGGDGGRGGDAGSGGLGGNGGNGGQATLVVSEELEGELTIRSDGGVGGAGGLAGRAGQGGAGGEEGALTSHCNTADRHGSEGSRGKAGKAKRDGSSGEPGTIRVVIAETEFEGVGFMRCSGSVCEEP